MKVSKRIISTVFCMSAVSILCFGSAAMAGGGGNLPGAAIAPPDFIVESLAIDGKTALVVLPYGATPNFLCNYKNLGTPYTGGVVASAYIDSKGLSMTKEIKFNNSIGTHTFQFPPSFLSPGEHTFRCGINIDKPVNESNKANNFKEMSFETKYGLTKSCAPDAAPNPNSKKGPLMESSVSRGDRFVCKYNSPPGGFPASSASPYFSYETPCKGAAADKQVPGKFSCAE